MNVNRVYLCTGLAAGLVGAVGAVTRSWAQAAPQPAACSAPEYRQFDFWVGTWDVAANGKHAGVNRIEKILDGCALLESWTGAGGYRGNSLNFYDASLRQWHQTWIDQAGNPLALDGTFADGKLTLSGARPGAASGETVAHRIVWTPLPSGQVRQLWETSTDGGNTWAVAFDGLYTRQLESSGAPGRV
jgi:hypothetical protein